MKQSNSIVSSKMTVKFCLFLMISVILILIPRSNCKATKENIINLDTNQPTVKIKTREMAWLTSKCLLSLKNPLSVGEKLNDKLIRYLHRSAKTSIISLASSKLLVEESYSTALKNKEWYCGQHYYRFMWKSSGFLLSASSPANLKEQIDNMKNSRWWNSHGYFLFTEDDDSNSESCSNAYEFLSLAWRYELLSSVFLCQEQDQTLSIYSFDPYGNSAPQPWLKNRELTGHQGHPWNFFKWEKFDGRRFGCDTIFYDKTKSLNGYPLLTNAVSVPPFLYFNKNRTSVEMYKGEDGRIMRDIWGFLNATIIDVSRPDDELVIGWMDDNGTSHGNLIDISSGKVEIGLNSMLVQPMWKVTATYPHTASSICSVTKDRGAIPWLIGLAMVFDKWTMICSASILSVATMIFGYFDKRRYFSSLLNTLRVFVSTSFIRPPARDGLRIVLCSVLLMPLISYSTFQGKILSLIRNPLRYTNFDNIEEMRSAGVEVQIIAPLKNVVSEELIRSILVPVDDIDTCLAKLYRDEPVACASYCYTLRIKNSYLKKLYISHERSPNYSNRYIAKSDWALLDRFNVVLQRMVESGLVHFYRVRGLHDASASPVSSENDSSDTAMVINLHEFRYVFIGLGIGWMCGIIAFIYEVFEGRLKRAKIFKIRITRI